MGKQGASCKSFLRQKNVIRLFAHGERGVFFTVGSLRFMRFSGMVGMSAGNGPFLMASAGMNNTERTE